MIKYIKTGKPADEKRDIDQQIAKTVETILADIEARGWAAIQNLLSSRKRKFRHVLIV
jgi:sulfopropanediol 3-dehydrogenase